MAGISYLEFTAFILSCIGIILEKYEKNIFWLFYIVASLLFVYEFIEVKLYASSAIQSLYVLIAIYGLWNWSRKSNGSNTVAHIQYMTSKLRLQYFIASGIVWLILYVVSVKINDASPVIDSLILMLAMLASVLSCYKYIESWLVFILVGIIEVALYYSSGLVFTAITCAVMTVLDMNGYFYWRKLYYTRLNYVS